MKKKNKIVPLPFNAYFVPLLFFIVTGIISCSYLFFIHYRNYTDPAFSSICALSKAINCDTVAQSGYSVLFSLPVALWGLFSFLFLFFLSLRAKNIANRSIWLVFFLLGIAGSLVAVYFGYVSAIQIKAYCIFCIVCDLCFFGGTFYAFLILKRFKIGFRPGIFKNGIVLLFTGTNFLIILFFCIIVTTTVLVLPHYWEMSIPGATTGIQTGFTANGSPWIGAENPQLTINEFTDYMCFRCYQMHSLLRIFVARYPDKIRLVHHNFPLDHKFNPLVKEPFHIGAGKMALLAIQAASLGKFWQVNDLLYRAGWHKGGQLDVRKLAAAAHLDGNALALGLRDRKDYIKLQQDIRRGLKAGITATPSYIVNGKIYIGRLPASLLRSVQ